MFAASKSGKSSAGGGGTTDPYFPYVPLLLETTSTNGQQNNTFLDSSSNTFTITRNGTPTQGSITPYWPNGQWSNYFNGSADYLTVGASAALNPGAGNFTFECWIYATSTPTNLGIFQGNTSGFAIGFNPSSQLAVSQAGVAYLINDSTAFTLLNQWIHIAVVRSSTTLSLYKNGSRVATSASNSTNFVTSTQTYIASNSSTQFPGYISNLRLAIGTAVYDPTLTTLTVPTAPLTSTTGGTTPPTGTQTKLLICQSNRFIDNASSPNTITLAGTPQVQAFQPFSPSASYTTALYGGGGYFNGSTDYLTTPSNSAFYISSGQFTIEAWIYKTATGNFIIIAQSQNNGVPYAGWTLRISSTGNLVFEGTNGALVTGATALPNNTWIHVAAVRVTSAIVLYVNGKSDNTGTPAITDYAGTLTVGNYTFPVAGRYFSGYISNLRFVKGAAVYTGNFTPPTLAPLTTLGTTSAASYTDTTNVNTTFTSGTSLLLNFTNAGIYDAAVQNNTITVGDAQASTTQYKWSPTSMKFDGTGDWLTAIENPQLQLGTGDFTIDGWVYLSANGVAYGIVSKGTASTGWSVNVTSGNRLQFSYTASNLTGATTTLAATTWYYFAVVRSGSATGNLKIYINGALEATSGGAVTDNFNQTDILYVGASRTGTTPLNGYLQDVRITKAARTITTPTAAFPTR